MRILMESLNTSGSNSPRSVRNVQSPPPPPLAWMMIKSLLLEEKGGDVEAFKFTVALYKGEDDDDDDGTYKMDVI